MTTVPITLAAAAFSGLVIGSFLNVLIYRLPRQSSVVTGRSRCPHCNNTIRWFDNVPVLSYLFLAGRCRQCHKRISPVYPIVELASAAAALLAVHSFGVTVKALWIYVFLAVLLVITVIDWHHRIIPDVLSVGGVLFGWVGSIVCLDIGLVESLVGSLVGGGLLLAIAVLYRAIRRIEGMGGGDVKLMAMIGAFLGWQMVFPVLFIASLFGSMYGLFLITRGGTGTTAVAFGSFLAPSAIVVLLVGQRLWSLYLGL